MPRFGAEIWSYCHSSSADQKVEALERILDKIYDQLTANRRYYQGDSEDKLTINIVEKLQAIGIHASHDTDVGGHCDIVVESDNGDFRWLAEAKIHSSYDWLLKGFMQLATRYGVATQGKDRGEVIIYCRNENARQVLEKWLEFLARNKEEVSLEADKEENLLRFRTVHKCRTSGLSFRTRHSIIPLRYEPES